MLNQAELSVDFLKYRQRNGLTLTNNFFGNLALSVGGTIVIKDPDGTNNTGVQSSGPGLFIYNQQTGSTSRAFSGSENAWAASLDGVNLQVSAPAISIGKLTFNTTDINLRSTIASIITPIQSTDVFPSLFTHSIPVTINGETYYLCLSLED